MKRTDLRKLEVDGTDVEKFGLTKFGDHISDLIGTKQEVYLKLESEQVTGSFK